MTLGDTSSSEKKSKSLVYCVLIVIILLLLIIAACVLAYLFTRSGEFLSYIIHIQIEIIIIIIIISIIIIPLDCMAVYSIKCIFTYLAAYSNLQLDIGNDMFKAF